MKRIAFWIVLTLCVCVSWSPAFAAKVEGIGIIGTSLPDPFTEIYTEYQHPVFLDVAKAVQLNSSQVGGVGNHFMSYFGQAQFGRLSAKSFTGGTHPSMPDLSTGVEIDLRFQDQITPQNLNPQGSNYLRLDVELSGVMTKNAPNSSTRIGGATTAIFQINMQSLDFNTYTGLSEVRFLWFGDDFFITDETQGSGATPGFVPYPGEDPGFTPLVTGGYSFGARGYVDVPLDDPLFGPSFLLEVVATAGTSLGVEGVTETDFGSTALIGNARLVDQNGNPIPGASFTSVSGYDYITPPSPITPGDIDLDGDVDRTDAALFAQYFGTTSDSIWTTGDFDGDSATTLADFALLQTHLGMPGPSPPNATAAVPEPSTWMMAMILTATILLVMVRRRCQNTVGCGGPFGALVIHY